MHGIPPSPDEPTDRATSPDEAAAAWLVRSHGGLGRAEREALAKWLAEDPAHAVALARLRSTWAFLDDVAPAHRRRRRNARFRRAALVAAATVVVAVAGSVVWWERMPPPAAVAEAYRTARGEQRQVTLADGSLVWLDTGTVISVRLSEGGRDVALSSGQALFDVTHDVARPFVVHTATAQVRVVGTRFGVRETPTGLVSCGTDISVTRGHVQVTDPRGQGRVDLLAGQAAHVAPLGLPARLANGAGEAWRDGRVVFDDTPLPDAVAELERYGDTHLAVAPSARGLHVTGSFTVGNADAFAKALPQILPVRLERHGAEVRIVARQGSR
ncbi:FecR domain-containing protein [Luteibacter aegosomaticola]|uniref:FecR family protein n=1 Tax=Luteibacter aegosomaticola TaxID=2911538 RepID=UPI001FF75FAB|nr:FecR domain-containing protein [Luteibacter aegosomaticola]UPG88233.1 FecR domain-containing protein [Luteibacter aegosomaticola]